MVIGGGELRVERIEAGALHLREEEVESDDGREQWPRATRHLVAQLAAAVHVLLGARAHLEDEILEMRVLGGELTLAHVHQILLGDVVAHEQLVGHVEDAVWRTTQQLAHHVCQQQRLAQVAGRVVAVHILHAHAFNRQNDLNIFWGKTRNYEFAVLRKG